MPPKKAKKKTTKAKITSKPMAKIPNEPPKIKLPIFGQPHRVNYRPPSPQSFLKRDTIRPAWSVIRDDFPSAKTRIETGASLTFIAVMLDGKTPVIVVANSHVSYLAIRAHIWEAKHWAQYKWPSRFRPHKPENAPWLTTHRADWYKGAGPKARALVFAEWKALKKTAMRRAKILRNKLIREKKIERIRRETGMMDKLEDAII